MGERPFRRSLLGYRRGDVEESLRAWAQAVSERDSTLESRERG